MSMQRVNLYLPELRPKKEWLTANTIALSAIGFSLLMVLTIVLVKDGLREFESQVELVEQQKIATEERIQRIKNMPRVNTHQYDRKLLNLRRLVKARERIGQIILGQNLGNETGFSTSMNGLSRHAFASISLQQIRFSRGGSFVEIRGVTRIVEDIPLYIQALRSEESFANTRFGLMSVATVANNHRRHQFALGFESVYQLAAEKGAN